MAKLLVPLGVQDYGKLHSYLSPAASLPPSCCFSLEHPPNSASWSAGKKCWQQGMVQGVELGAFIEELLHAACAVSVSEMKWKQLVIEKNAPVVDPETGNLSVLSQMEAADENWSF